MHQTPTCLFFGYGRSCRAGRCRCSAPARRNTAAGFSGQAGCLPAPAVRLADGQIRVTAEQVEGNFLMVVQHGFLADPVKAGHGFPFSENRMVQKLDCGFRPWLHAG